MYLHLKILWKAVSLTVSRRRLRPRYIAWSILLLNLFGAVWATLAIGRLLDHLFFPGFRRQEVRGPVFVIAPPRSGTTHLQNLLCLDSERFNHLALYQTIFPCVLYLRIFELLARCDRLVGGPFRKLLATCEKRWFRGWDGLHTLRLGKPEEDEAFFVYTLVSEAIFMLFPLAAEIPEAALADRLPAGSRRRLMAFYRSCLKRHLYATGDDRILLSKNTLHSGRISALLEAFPDARIITIVRDPRETIPSSVKLFYLAWKAHSPEIAADSPESRAYAEINAEYYLNLHANRERLRASGAINVSYVELVTQPGEVVSRIYRHFGWEIQPAYGDRLEAAHARSRNYSSVNEYSLEEFGLDEDWIQRRLGDVIEANGLHRSGTPRRAPGGLAAAPRRPPVSGHARAGPGG